MDATQAGKFAMYETVAELLGGSTAIISTIPALPALLADFQTQIDAIPGLVGTQAQPTTGVTADKQSVLQAMADTALEVAAGVASYASKNHLGDLAAKVAAKPSAFANGRDLEHLALAQQIHDAANGVLAALADFGVLAADLSDLQAKIDKARAVLNAPRAAANVKKSATQQLPDAFRAADEILNNQIDPLAAKLAKKNPDFYAKYQAARIIIDRPGGHASPAAPPAVSPSNPPSASAPAATVKP